MRLFIAGLAAAGLLGSQIASAACISPSDREALDVAGLKTNLMVVTLTCHTDTQYNAFINKYKPELINSDREVRAYFGQSASRLGQKRQDEFMTQVANAKADASQRDGTRFCAHNDEIFSEVMALKNGRELAQYAAGRATAMPAAYETCDKNAAPVTHAAERRVVRRRAHR